MNNNTERLARNWAEMIKSASEGAYGLSTIAAADHILATTAAPETMEDVEWDDDEHHLTGAILPGGSEAVMMCYDVATRSILTDMGKWKRNQLTPNGKRYELREISKPEHPEILTTAEDYERAPKGTIVVRKGFSPYSKERVSAWSDTFNNVAYSDDLSGTSRKVLRWGWGE